MTDPRTACESALARLYEAHEGMPDDSALRGALSFAVGKILQDYAPAELRDFELWKDKSGRWQVKHCVGFLDWLEGSG